MKLPYEFLNKMKNLLGDDEFVEFLESYDTPRYYGLRVNTLKISVPDFLKISPFKLEPIPWTVDGFYYSGDENPGKHPFYYSGLYYIQEPSAILPGSVLDAKPGENILDLCAAPGGKAVQLAAGMKGKGLLVANDINHARVKVLVKNIELSGVRNAIVTNDSPERLAKNFFGFFDKILVDAPCSGEGMFRKDADAIRGWEKFQYDRCTAMQQNILDSADKMLKAGGTLVYSTCTFSPEEDECMISAFLSSHNDYEVVDIPKHSGIEAGRPHWSDGNPELSKTVRLWPHRVNGEGHFVAALRKKSILSTENTSQDIIVAAQIVNNITNLSKGIQRNCEYDKNSPTLLEAFNSFVDENLNLVFEGRFIVKGDILYCLPVQMPDLSGIKVGKFGWYLGTFANGKFEPSHSFAVSLKKGDIKNVVDFPSWSREVCSYLKGETLMIEGVKGFTGICVDGHTLGWAKQTGDMLKNLYPKGWRKMS